MIDFKDMEYAPEMPLSAIPDVPYGMSLFEHRTAHPAIIERLLSNNGNHAIAGDGVSNGEHYVFCMFNCVLIDVYPGKKSLKLSGDVGEGLDVSELTPVFRYFSEVDFKRNEIKNIYPTGTPSEKDPMG